MNTKNAKRKHKEGWDFIQFPISQNVIIASRLLKWYNEEEFERLTKELSNRRCRVFFDLGDCPKDYQKKTCRVEVYLRTEKTSINDQVEEMLEKLKIIPL